MASFVKFQPFVENLAEKVFNLGSDTLKVALTNTAPVNTQGVFAPGTDHPPPAAANGYAPVTCAQVSSEQTSGTYKLIIAQAVFTAASGQIGPFRYVLLYDDTAAGDQLIGYYDYGSSITLEDTDTFTVAFHQTNGVLTIA